MTLDELQKEVTELKNRKEAVARENDDYTLRKIRSNLFFDDETKVQYLANQRFPNEDSPADRYFNKDGTLFYLDDNNILQREFPDNQVTGFLGANLYPNIVPAITFAADVGGGVVGAKKGFELGTKLPIPNPVVKAEN